MTAPEPVSDALTVARWKDPKRNWHDDTFESRPIAQWFDLKNPACGRFDPASPKDIAECEALMVERGLGRQYGEALCCDLLSPTDPFPRGWDDLAAIRTAPLSTILRALAAVVRAEGEKAK